MICSDAMLNYRLSLNVKLKKKCLTLYMDVCHRSPEYPTDYVCHAQSFIDNLQTINQIYIKIDQALAVSTDCEIH